MQLARVEIVLNCSANDRVEVLMSLLSLVKQLCRIDGVIAVKRGTLLNKQRKDEQKSDSESEE